MKELKGQLKNRIHSLRFAVTEKDDQISAPAPQKIEELSGSADIEYCKSKIVAAVK